MSVDHNITNNLCSNWWPSLHTSEKMEKGMPHPMCRMCANWLPIEDIEDIEDIKKSGCGNDWPEEKNKKKRVPRYNLDERLDGLYIKFIYYIND